MLNWGLEKGKKSQTCGAWLESSSVKPNAATPGEASRLRSYIKELEQPFRFPGRQHHKQEEAKGEWGGSGEEVRSWVSQIFYPQEIVLCIQMPGMGGNRLTLTPLTGSKFSVISLLSTIFSSPSSSRPPEFPVHTIALGMWVINVLSLSLPQLPCEVLIHFASHHMVDTDILVDKFWGSSSRSLQSMGSHGRHWYTGG